MHSLIVGRNLDGLAAGTQEFDRRQIQGIEGPHRHREGFDSASKHGRRQFDQGHATHQLPRMVTMRWRQLQGMKAGPDLVFEEAAEIGLPCQNDAGSERSSASKWASPTELSS